ncbi:MAG: phosphatidate cytidylyltransferase [Prevotellaceae bacterium]|jgi:phosphatidate cytidylyltransferase|nr:phosphatidate cytidylyltransferase [Prevotellaceae bacterium]
MRNLIIRTASGLLFLAIMIGSILWNTYAFAALTCIIIIIGMFEFFNLTIPKRHLSQKTASIFIGLSGVLFFNPVTNNKFLSAFFVIVAIACLTMIWIIELYKKSEKPIENIALFILPIIYIAVPFTLMHYLNCFDPDGKFYILAFFILIWANDVGAYCFGILFGKHGKHKFFPRISPKKTWEGFAGGIITAIIASVIIAKSMLNIEIYHLIIIAITTSVFGTFGDLAESMLKRSAGVKDSGKIMPGHGGILDRFDSAIFAFPMVFVYYMILIY